MSIKKVTAIVQRSKLEHVETALRDAGVPGISVTIVNGYGDYANFFKSPPLVSHARLEIFIEEDKVSTVVDAIMNNAHTGMESDGIIAVLPVEHFYRIREKQVLYTSDDV